MTKNAKATEVANETANLSNSVVLPEGFLTSKVEILSAIAAGKEAYQQSRAWLHARASEVLYHAAQFGDSETLVALGNMVSKNDKASFIAWVRRVSSYVNAEGKNRTWLKYTDDKGFQVLTSSEIHRKDKFTPAELIAGTPFFEVERAKRTAVAKDVAAIKAVSTSIADVKTLAARFEKHNIKPSAEVDDAMELIAKFLKAQLRDLEDAGTETPAINPELQEAGLIAA